MSSPALSRDRSPGPSRRDHPPAECPPAPAARAARQGGPAIRRLAGRYRYDLRRSAWWWSPEMAALRGSADDVAEASTERLLEYLHPEDRARTLAALTAACTEARPFTLRIRILRGDGEQRAAVLLGEPETEPDGAVSAVEGLLLDITDSAPPDGADDRSDALQTEVAQMRAAMASRAAIEQAKGILMLLTSCSDHVAFDLLAHISSHTHRKVRDVAESITESAAGHAQLPEDVRAIVRDACPPPRRRR
jgi:hypothetical protein